MSEAHRAARPSPDLRTHVSSATTRAALLVQQQVLTSVRAVLADLGFVELSMPVVGPVTDPGVRGAKQVDVDYYGATYKIMTSAILYKQAALLSFDKIFSIAPNVRLEPPDAADTGRHLVEFHQIDVEIAGAGRTEAMSLVQTLVREAVRGVVTHLPDVLADLGRDTGAFSELLERDFRVLTHGAAVDELVGMGVPQNAHAEISWEGELTLSRKAQSPFFISDYPKGSRGFYDRESRSTPGVLRNFDLLAPAGFGELVSGAEREHEYGRVITRIRETGENPAKYDWYLRVVRDGIPPSAGFGLGLERLVRFITGLDAIWQVCAFPKLPGVVET